MYLAIATDKRGYLPASLHLCMQGGWIPGTDIILALLVTTDDTRPKCYLMLNAAPESISPTLSDIPSRLPIPIFHLGACIAHHGVGGRISEG